MSAKRALVVDDSKSARVVLSRMLEKYGIAVDTAESAEAALDLLRQSHPDVVFMDHLMPGMDGLQAVAIMKSEPATADIPVVMYTSQEGELYVGKAKALGAVGVLPKTVRPIDVTKILYQLRLLPDRRDTAPSPLQPVDDHGEQPPPATATAAAPSAAAMDPTLRGFVEAMLKEQSLELRRFMVATLDSQAQRLISELKPAPPEEPEPLPPPPAEPAARPWGWFVALAALVVAVVVLGGLYWQLLQTNRDVETARARFQKESAALQVTLDKVRQSSRPSPASTDRPVASAPPVQTLTVPYGQSPLAAPRLDAVRTLVAGLERDGFEGSIRLRTVAGTFCLMGNADDGYTLAPAKQPASTCDYHGNPYDDALTGAARQPVAFANFVAMLRQRTGGRIDVILTQGSPDDVVVAYPQEDRATAGEWNEAAAANNRLEILVVPK